MSDVHCARCGTPAAPDAPACSRCGAYLPAATDDGAYEGRAHGGQAHGGQAHGSWAHDDPPTVHVADWAPYTATAQPPWPPNQRPGPAWGVIGAVAAAVLAAAAAAVVVVTHLGGSGPQAAASTSSSASPVTRSSSAPPSRPAVTVTLSQGRTVTAPVPGTGRPAGGTVPRTVAALRAAFTAATPVSTSPYLTDNPYTAVFTSTTGNIECFIETGDEDPQSLGCTIGRYDFPQPGPDCDDGGTVAIDSYGNPSFAGCASTPYSPSSPGLAYGASISLGSYGCIDEPVGVSCLDLSTGTGFTLSRQEFVPIR